MNVIIIEDEQYAFDKLSILLALLDENIKIVGHGKSIAQAVEIIKMHKDIDLAFFDIQLSDGLCFNIFDSIDFSFPVIFTTAFDNHAIKAFKHNSIDYLLKPIRKSELEAALQKFGNIWQPNKNQIKIFEKLQQLEQKIYKERFVVKIGDHIKMIKTNDINSFYSMDKTTFMQTCDNRNYALDYTLEELNKAINPKLFFKVSRKYIVNINSIKDMVSYSNSRLKIVLNTPTDDDIIVSREKVKEFKNWLQNN